MKQQDLTKDNINMLFLKYLFPAVSATLVTSIYILADTIIIGKGIGVDAVAALNIVLPLFTLFFGTGLLFGVGGSVLFSISKGQGDEQRANQYFSITAMGAIAVIVLYLLLCNVFYEPLMAFLGTTEQTIHYVNHYAPYIIWGIPVFVTSSFLQTFIRNDKNPNLSMVAVVTGGILNIIFDIIFVFQFDWDMMGAALATVLGGLITCIILATHFFSKKNTLRFTVKGLQLRMLWTATLTGFSSFLMEVCGGIVILTFNMQLLKYTGVIGITAYSIISNTALAVTSLGNGISQAAQPILATNYGANHLDRVKRILHLGLQTTILVGSLFFAAALLIPEAFVYIYINPTKEVLPLAQQAVRFYSFTFLGMCINSYLGNYFQAILKPYYSLTISLLRGLILTIGFVYLLPLFLGVNGIWLTMPLVELVTLLVSISLVFITNRKMKA